MLNSGIVFCEVRAVIDALDSRSVNVDAQISKSFVRLVGSLLEEIMVLRRNKCVDDLFEASLKGGKFDCERRSAAG